LGLNGDYDNRAGHAEQRLILCIVVCSPIARLHLNRAIAEIVGTPPPWWLKSTFREGYESANENAERASEESNNRGTNSSGPSEPNKAQRSRRDCRKVS
jgi:hypothetical protein